MHVIKLNSLVNVIKINNIDFTTRYFWPNIRTIIWRSNEIVKSSRTMWFLGKIVIHCNSTRVLCTGTYIFSTTRAFTYKWQKELSYSLVHFTRIAQVPIKSIFHPK